MLQNRFTLILKNASTPMERTVFSREHCINQTCDRFDGRCLVGCTEGKTCDPGKTFIEIYRQPKLG